MVWWLFRRKKEEGDSLQKNLRISFSNIKKDVDSLGSWIKVLDSRDKGMVEEIKLIKQELLILNQNIKSLNQLRDELESEDAEEASQEHEKKKFNLEQFNSELLTETQEIILVKLLKIQKEEGIEAAPLKQLARECYNKEYSQVRSTISEYTGYLEELGLITRKKKGKQVFIAVTEKGRELAKKLSQEKSHFFIKKEASSRRQ